MPDVPVSVVLLTWNSAKTLRKALESAPGADEIILVDGGSTDDTLKIGKEFGAKIIPQNDDKNPQPINDFSAVRNRGLKATTKPWILFLDSDESLSPDLWSDIRRIAKKKEAAAYKVSRRYVLEDGTVVAHATTYPNRRLYFFHRDAVEKWIKPVHERIKVKPNVPVRRTEGWTLAPLPSPQEFWKKNQRYLDLELKHTPKGWMAWLQRFFRALRMQATSILRLLWIWLIPRKGAKLPLAHELVRWRYRWTLVWRSCPLFR